MPSVAIGCLRVNGVGKHNGVVKNEAEVEMSFYIHKGCDLCVLHLVFSFSTFSFCFCVVVVSTSCH